MDLTYTISIYIDDMLLMLQASIPNIQITIQLFQTFEETSALLCKWQGTKIALISQDPLPLELNALDSTWESNATSSSTTKLFWLPL